MRRAGLILTLAVAGLLGTGRVQAAQTFNDVAKVSVSVEPATARRGETVTWKLTVELIPGWHTYPTKQVDANAENAVNSITFPEMAELAPAGALQDPIGYIAKPDPGAMIKELRYYEGKTTWEQKFVVRADAKPGTVTIKPKLRILACQEKCLPPQKLSPEVALTISDAPPVSTQPPKVEPGTAEPSERGAVKAAPAKAEAGEPITAVTEQEYKAGMEAIAQQIQANAGSGSNTQSDLIAFILSGIFWGAISLITPCVFPMIPITVSFFLKQSEKEHHRPVAMAVVYCTTIVIVLTMAAVLLLSFFRWLSVLPAMNYFVGGLFIFFALSLFGMYEIELPSALTRFTSSREGQGGVAGTVFMALTFTILSFACVAPFLGGFGGTSATASMTWLQRILGGLAFSATFASPFFVLALFPTLLKKMPKSGSWLNSVKVVMGFLELAAALKFFRSAEVFSPTPPSFFTYDLVMGIYIALCVLAGLYLLGIYRLPHDTPSEHLGVPRMLLSVAFLALAIYLVPALFRMGNGEKQRPAGALYAWIDSFLLPEADTKQGDLKWTGDLKKAIAEARNRRKQTGKPEFVFIDFTGVTCVNCAYNERSVFSRDEIQKAFRPYHLVKLYTDIVPENLYASGVRDKGRDRQEHDAEVNLAFQRSTFQTEQLPLYVILEPLPDNQIKVAGKYSEGKINDPLVFAQFLKEPLESQALAQAKAGN